MQSEGNVTTGTRRAVRLGEVGGDLRIQRWQEPGEDLAQILVASRSPTNVTATTPMITDLADDTILLLAEGCDAVIDSVSGDLVVEQVGGNLRVEKVRGDTTITVFAGDVAIVRAGGDVSVRDVTGDMTLVSVKGDLSLDHISGSARVDAVSGDVTMRGITSAELGNIAGDMRAQDITALIVRGGIGGDAVFAAIDRLNVMTVAGDLTAFEINEVCEIQKVAGDARMRHLRSAAVVQQIHGDLAAQDIPQGLTTVVDGDAYVETSLGANARFVVTANEIVLRVRSPISAQFVAQATNGEIRTHLPLTVERHRQHLVGIIGHGEAMVTLTSIGGDILLDAAGASEREQEDSAHESAGHFDKRGFRVHIDTGPDGPNIKVHTPFGTTNVDPALFGWPFGGNFTMSSSTPDDFEQRLRDIGERTGRAARKAAEKAREYSDRASARARDTDWDAVSRDVRTAIERTVAELETTFREIVSEFNAPTSPPPVNGNASTQRNASATSQRVPIDHDPVDATTEPIDREAKRRAILEQLRSGDLTLDEANDKLREL